MEVAAWIETLTALAGMVSAWLSLREKLTSKDFPTPNQREAVTNLGKAAATAVAIPNLIVDETILRAVIEDVKAREARFAAAIRDPMKTTEEIDQEQADARRGICIHLQRLQELNAGELPTDDLKRMWLSFDCRAWTDKIT